jgi:uncharacterized membrane protein
MYIKKIIVIFLIFLAFLFPTFANAQEFKEEFFKAEVINILEDREINTEAGKNYYQKAELRLLNGPDENKQITVDHGGQLKINESQKIKKGEVIVLTKLQSPDSEPRYIITDKYRINQLIWMAVGFFVLVFIVAGKKSFGALLGLIISMLVIVKFIVPQILAGRDPLLISIAGALAILFVTIYLAHGLNRQTTIALIATFITLAITGVISVLAVKLAFLTGMGSEEASTLQLGPTSNINLQGLLLGGIIIGALGVLDDITTTQSAAVFELSKMNPKLKFEELFKKGLNIGKEHIASLVNTLVLAYAGASLPIFILFVFNPRGVPIEIILNSEIIAEEIVRTLSGSAGLILAVPIATALSAWSITKSSKRVL